MTRKTLIRDARKRIEDLRASIANAEAEMLEGYDLAADLRWSKTYTANQRDLLKASESELSAMLESERRDNA